MSLALQAAVRPTRSSVFHGRCVYNRRLGVVVLPSKSLANFCKIDILKTRTLMPKGWENGAQNNARTHQKSMQKQTVAKKWSNRKDTDGRPQLVARQSRQARWRIMKVICRNIEIRKSHCNKVKIELAPMRVHEINPFRMDARLRAIMFSR